MNSTFTPAEIILFLLAYIGTWMIWGSINFRLLRRWRLVGTKAVLVSLLLTFLVEIGLFFVWAILKGWPFAVVKVSRLAARIIWGTLMGLCMGCVIPTLNARRLNEQEFVLIPPEENPGK